MDLKFIFLYFAAISTIAAVMTIADKIFAVRGKRRLSENSLLCVAALGGSVSMFICMLIIRNKTYKIYGRSSAYYHFTIAVYNFCFIVFTPN